MVAEIIEDARNRGILCHHIYQLDPPSSHADPCFVVVYLLQVLGLKCRQFEMDISSAYPGGCSGECICVGLVPFSCCVGNDSIFTAPVTL